MLDARYYRATAEFCLQMAGKMSDPWAADIFKAQAARYQAEAAAIEAEEQPQVSLRERTQSSGGL
jgi:hypothetical protein